LIVSTCIWACSPWYDDATKFKVRVELLDQGLKMLCLYLLGQNCLHLTFQPYLNSETYSRKYEELPTIVINACKNITEKMNLLKMCGAQNLLCLFTFGRIESKQLNSLTTINTLSWLDGAVVTHLLWVLEVLAPARVFMIEFLFCCFYFLSKSTLFVTQFCNSFCNVYSFSIPNILHDLWPIIRV